MNRLRKIPCLVACSIPRGLSITSVSGIHYSTVTDFAMFDGGDQVGERLQFRMPTKSQCFHTFLPTLHNYTESSAYHSSDACLAKSPLVRTNHVSPRCCGWQIFAI